MAIEEIKHPDGRWQKIFTGKDVGEAYNQGLQEYGAQKFQEAWKRNESIGFEKLRNAHGQTEYVRADETDQSLASGFSPVGNPTMVMPDVPWPKTQLSPGRHKFKYDRESGQMVEVD